ncbi:MAG: isoaspartyl peptidase/L-asparaginase [Bacteroidota bacterium]|nr:isoaspartyl peptidase/L-asparaginase [Bacteroidota bacterium]
MSFSIAIHGGAGTILKQQMSPAKEKEYLNVLQNALNIGINILKSGGDALDAVQETVVFLENTPHFNAGKGSVFTNDGLHEMDASIMYGKNLKAGAVAAIRNVKNPIVLSRRVMDNSGFVLLVGRGAEEFARVCGLDFEDNQYFYTDYRFQQWQAIKEGTEAVVDHFEPKKFGTVGAVARDIRGNLAAATSTGGLTNKRYGRVGDTSVIGAGTYANNKTCAVSCTGYGESFIRSVVAYDVSALMEYKKCTLNEACEIVVKQKLVEIGGEGGLIAIDFLGNIEMPFNTQGMYRGSYSNATGELNVSIY